MDRNLILLNPASEQFVDYHLVFVVFSKSSLVNPPYLCSVIPRRIVENSICDYTYTFA